MSSKRISFKVVGEVQGVFFRYIDLEDQYALESSTEPRLSDFTEKNAKSLSLTGFVQNARDGSVVGEAQGDEADLQKFVGHLNKGPSSASVDNVESKDISTKSGETGFGVH